MLIGPGRIALLQGRGAHSLFQHHGPPLFKILTMGVWRVVLSVGSRNLWRPRPKIPNDSGDAATHFGQFGRFTH